MTSRAEVGAVLAPASEQRPLARRRRCPGSRGRSWAAWASPATRSTASLSSSARMPKRCASPMRHALDRDRHVGALAPVLLDERAVVHLVDVVAGEDEHDVGAGLADGLDVLERRRRPCRDTTRGAVARDVRLHACRTPPVVRSRSHGRPDADVVVERARVVLRQHDDVVMSELTQLQSVKSMIRYLPAKGTAGLARMPERSDRRSPSPPARTTANVLLTCRCYTAPRMPK